MSGGVGQAGSVGRGVEVTPDAAPLVKVVHAGHSWYQTGWGQLAIGSAFAALALWAATATALLGTGAMQNLPDWGRWALLGAAAVTTVATGALGGMAQSSKPESDAADAVSDMSSSLEPQAPSQASIAVETLFTEALPSNNPGYEAPASPVLAHHLVAFAKYIASQTARPSLSHSFDVGGALKAAEAAEGAVAQRVGADLSNKTVVERYVEVSALAQAQPLNSGIQELKGLLAAHVQLEKAWLAMNFRVMDDILPLDQPPEQQLAAAEGFHTEVLNPGQFEGLGNARQRLQSLIRMEMGGRSTGLDNK